MNTVGTLSQCPHLQDSLKAGIFFSQTSLIYFSGDVGHVAAVRIIGVFVIAGYPQGGSVFCNLVVFLFYMYIRNVSQFILWRGVYTNKVSVIYLSGLFGQEGWIFGPGSFLRFYGPRGSRDQKKRKKGRGQYPTILTEQDWTLKD